MQHWWVAEVVLALSCWWGSYRLLSAWRAPAFLAAVTLALLGLTAAVGAVKFGFQWQAQLNDWHYYTARAFGVAGLYLLFMALLDWIGWLRLHRGLWLAHLADATLIFLLGWWLQQLPNFQLVIGLLANLLCLVVAATLWRRGRPIHGQWLAFSALLFLLNSLVVRGGSEPFLGLPIRMDIFHLLLALWAFCITQVIYHPCDEDPAKALD